MILPAPITYENRLTALLVGSIVFFLGYSIPNHYHLFPPQQLQLGTIDLLTPFVPWTVFIYLSEFAYFMIAYFLIKKDVTRNRYMWAVFSVEFVGILFFVLFPTTYPRYAYPLPPDTSAWITVPFNLLRIIDDPSNSFPSLHVATCFVTAFIFSDEARWKFIAFLLWAFAIAISTLTTKQHYMVDVVAGASLAVLSGYIFIRRAKYRPVNSSFVRVRIGG